MTDYMKEAKRLAQAYADAVLLGEGNDEALAALLAHIQRGAVPEGWQLVPKEPTEAMLLAGLGSNWPEDLYLRDVYESMLAAAPAPDHFRDGAGMAPVHCTPTEHEGRIVYEHTSEPIPNADGFVLYAPVPDQFRNAAKMMAVQPSCMTCTAPAPAEVPMPEPDAIDGTSQVSIAGCMGLGVVRVTPSYSEPKMRTYGAACRAAGESAGYARGRAEAGRDAERYRWLCDVATEQQWVELGGYTVKKIIDGAIDALRGEVKP